MTTATHDVTFTQRRYARLLKAHGFKLLYSDDNGLDQCWQHMKAPYHRVEILGARFTHVAPSGVCRGYDVASLCNALVTTANR